MAKLRVNQSIDVTKIDKARLYQGKKGKYLNITTFIDTDNPNEYGDHGFITQQISKEEREQGLQLPILGNSKVAYNDQSVNAHQQGMAQAQQAMNAQPAANFDDFDDDIPFSCPHSS